MANYKKSFNLRNGVQVDDDNFIVNANGLVGIGTSVPTEFLDVRGNVRVVGLVNANNLTVGVSTLGVAAATNLTAQNINVSGIITASSIKIGSSAAVNNIVGYATDAWVINPTGITTTAKVGIGTVANPTEALNVTGNLVVTNNITSDSGNLTVSNGNISVSSGNINVTSGSLVLSNGNINASSGIITASSFSGALNATNLTSGTVSNSRLPSNISVSGIVTATQGFVGSVTGNVTGTASTAQSLTGSPNITVTNITASNINTSGIITATTRLYTESIGIGTSVPSSDIQVRRSGQAKIQVTSDTNASLIGFGRSDTITGYNGVLRYGNTSVTFPYSDPYSLDVLNYGPGNVNFYLEASNVSAATTGSFYWHRKPNLSRLMALTYDGKLGVGVTNPSNTFHVVGTSTVTGNAYFGSNVDVQGNLTISGSFSASSISANLTGNLTGNVNSTSGVSTFASINATGIATIPTTFVDKLGIGTDIAPVYYDLDGTRSTAGFRSVGVGTTSVRCAVDLADAGKGVSSDQFAYMIVPRLTTAARSGLSTVAGALIFNTTTSKFQGYTGVAWTDFH